MRKIDLDEAKNQLIELIRQAEKGQEVVLTQNDKPVARIVAVEKRRTRQFGSAKGLIQASDDFDEPVEDFQDYM